MVILTVYSQYGWLGLLLSSFFLWKDEERERESMALKKRGGLVEAVVVARRTCSVLYTQMAIR